MCYGWYDNVINIWERWLWKPHQSILMHHDMYLFYLLPMSAFAITFDKYIQARSFIESVRISWRRKQWTRMTLTPYISLPMMSFVAVFVEFFALSMCHLLGIKPTLKNDESIKSTRPKRIQRESIRADGLSRMVHSPHSTDVFVVACMYFCCFSQIVYWSPPEKIKTLMCTIAFN